MTEPDDMNITELRDQLREAKDHLLAIISASGWMNSPEVRKANDWLAQQEGEDEERTR